MRICEWVSRMQSMMEARDEQHKHGQILLEAWIGSSTQDDFPGVTNQAAEQAWVDISDQAKVRQHPLTLIA